MRRSCERCGGEIRWQQMAGIRLHTEGVYRTECACRGVRLRDADGNPLDQRRPAQNTTLTAQQERIWRFIADQILRTGLAPSLREICTFIGSSGTNGAAEHITALVRKGYVTRVSLVSRALTLVRWPDINPSDYGPGTHAHAVLTVMQGAEREAERE